jgi:hypothetical protein
VTRTRGGEKKKKLTIQARIAEDLKELRNKAVFAFFMFNALFILIVFLLQLNKDQLHIDWPLGVRTNITYIEETSQVNMTVSIFPSLFCCSHPSCLKTDHLLGQVEADGLLS